VTLRLYKGQFSVGSSSSFLPFPDLFLSRLLLLWSLSCLGSFPSLPESMVHSSENMSWFYSSAQEPARWLLPGQHSHKLLKPILCRLVKKNDKKSEEGKERRKRKEKEEEKGKEKERGRRGKSPGSFFIASIIMRSS
jgi:hypothetical protein